MVAMDPGGVRIPSARAAGLAPASGLANMAWGRGQGQHAAANLEKGHAGRDWEGRGVRKWWNKCDRIGGRCRGFVVFGEGLGFVGSEMG